MRRIHLLRLRLILKYWPRPKHLHFTPPWDNVNRSNQLGRLLLAIKQMGHIKQTQKVWRPIKATKKEVLSFFEEAEVVTSRMLMDRFGYAYETARHRLAALHRERLIEPLFERGTWGITKKGERRLLYLEQQ